MSENINILSIYIRQIERLKKDNDRLRKENDKINRILNAIKMYFIV
jgi:hypothetical protein